ncbi:MAG: excinuclease ABC subunit UvrC [Chloroflexi bacterium]|nr:excinuclease ABC subunit UvrC [Chloroflexota bacterium]
MERAYLEEKVKSLPHKPGVYLMREASGKIIYVGKATSLRNRVASYFGSLSGQNRKVANMVDHLDDFEYIVVDTEREALNLENTLIKEHRPFYNILLKDDKTYPFIKVTLNEKWPKAFIVRKVLEDGARYFGPFAGNGSAWRTLRLLEKLFPYRSCDLKITEKEPRPCLEYFIHRCLGPCAGLADKQEYDAAIAQVLLFLDGKQGDIIGQLEAKMEEAAENLEFERAALLRDQITAVRQITEQQKVVSSATFDEDILALAQAENEAAGQIFFVRGGKLIGREHFMLQNVEDESEAEILSSFVRQYYAEATFIPPRILLQYELPDSTIVAEWLSSRAGISVTLEVPTTGDKKDFVAMVSQNAQEALEQNRLRWLNDEQKTTAALAELQNQLELAVRPRRIECYDISNTQGTNSVASMVVFENGTPKKTDYRRFKIKTVEGPNDFASMQEVLRRRFKRAKTVEEASQNAQAFSEELAALEESSELSNPLDDGLSVQNPTDSQQSQVHQDKGKKTKSKKSAKTKEKPKAPRVDYSWQSLPDLIIIDGGKGQLSAAVEVMRELELADIPIVGLAKQREELFKPDNPISVYLPRTSEALYLVQRIRDEAHRFAITFHRQLRNKEATASALDSVPGIGPRRKQALLKAFGSPSKIKAASDEELLAVEGMNKATLAKIREFL